MPIETPLLLFDKTERLLSRPAAIVLPHKHTNNGMYYGWDEYNRMIDDQEGNRWSDESNMHDQSIDSFIVFIHRISRDIDHDDVTRSSQ
jgi:hypothetical protein